MTDETLVIVCSECKKACCLQGYFMCDGAVNASTIVLSIAILKKLDLENSDYWKGNNESQSV